MPRSPHRTISRSRVQHPRLTRPASAFPTKSPPMSEPLPTVYLARHGETAWTVSGQHTGLTDIPLTERGEQNARRLGERLKELSVPKVFPRPLGRGRGACDLAGFGRLAEVDPDLTEWHYGDYEGLTTADVHKA